MLILLIGSLSSKNLIMLNIIYRLHESEADGNIRSHRPNWFSKQKCLKSFLNSFNLCKNHVKNVIFLHDGNDGPLLDMIKDFDVIRIFENSNERSLQKTFEIADNLNDNIYFVEDDYLHLPDSIKKIDSVLPELKLVTGYDHLHRYTQDDGGYELKIVVRDNCHWRTAKSTCCTYAIEKDLYNRVSNVLKSYGLNDKDLFPQLRNMDAFLWTALPGLTTQVDPYLSPGIDWQKINENI